MRAPIEKLVGTTDELSARDIGEAAHKAAQAQSFIITDDTNRGGPNPFTLDCQFKYTP